MKIGMELWGAVAFGYRPAPPLHTMNRFLRRVLDIHSPGAHAMGTCWCMKQSGGAESEKGRVSNAMSKGIVLYDGETTGYYMTLENGAILINFETVRNSDNILELARETGAAIVLLEEPDIPGE